MASDIYNEEVADEICARIAEGEFLTVICREPGMPSRRTVYRWIDDKPEFASSMEKARQIGADAIAEQSMIDVAKEPERINTEHGDKIDPGHVQVMKLRADHSLKMLAKWHKGKYGDKLALTDGDGKPLQGAQVAPTFNITLTEGK